MTLIRSLILLVIGLVAFAACTTGGGNGVAEIPTATLAPIVSMTPRYTATPVASRTPYPTATFTPSETSVPPTPSDTPTPTSTPPVVGIVNSSQTVNVREGPGVNYGPLTSLDPGTGVEVLGSSSDGAWYNILMADGSQGWISSRLLRLEPSPTPFPTLTATIDETSIALGTLYPTAILGGNPVTPTLPPSLSTPDAESTGEAGDTVSVINQDSYNATATELIRSIVGNPTVGADGAATLPAGTPPAGETSQGPVGGPTGGPIGGPTQAPSAGQGSAGQASAQDGVDVLAYCDDPTIHIPAPTNLTAGATIDVFWSWYARTEAQVADHRDKVIYDVAVDGARLSNWRLYADPEVRLQDGNYYQYWYVPFGPLSAGQHTITYSVSWREQITDGYQDFGPGTANQTQTGTCTFTVH